MSEPSWRGSLLPHPGITDVYKPLQGLLIRLNMGALVISIGLRVVDFGTTYRGYYSLPVIQALRIFTPCHRSQHGYIYIYIYICIQ